MDDCIEWTGANVKGYGVFRYQGKNYRVHRAVFFFVHGYWPKECRHTCDNPPCYNPHHLIDGDHADNMKDASSRGRLWMNKVTHCPRGHEYDEKNTRLSQGKRWCRACDNARGREKRRLARENGPKRS